jgi:serine kinase of HPr protein (carbohydrate metabolism regulator)
MTTISSETLHASCIAIGGCAVLIEGLSGSGKSDLALRLIDRGAVLVSDDYTIVRRIDDRLIASAPPNITGLIEVRGVGLVPMPAEADVSVALIISISDDVERMPEGPETEVIAGVSIPRYRIAPFESSAPVKVEIMLKLKGLQ